MEKEELKPFRMNFELTAAEYALALEDARELGRSCASAMCACSFNHTFSRCGKSRKAAML